jgi:parallel beta-helix repeat protein
MKSTSAWVLASCLLVACGGDDTTSGGAGTANPAGGTGGTTSGAGGATGTGGAAGTSTGAGGQNTGTGGTSTGAGGGSGGAAGALGTGGAAGAGGGGMLPQGDEQLCGDVQIMANKTIAAGKLTTVCAGATITVANGMSITINGTLRVDGTMGMPVKFQGAAHGSTAWKGIAIAQGGSLQITYGEIHDANMPIDAGMGSSYTIDHLVIDNSRSMLHLASNGTIDHGAFHGLSNAQQIDPIIVDSASPHLTNTLIDKGGGKDYIQVNGATSAAVFDHLDLTGAHCAFHFNAGNGTTISNSNIHGNAYGLMVETSANIKITHNNFTQNAPAIGDCYPGGTATITDNYIQGVALGGQPTCANKLTAATPAAAAWPATGAGAVGPQ